MHRSLMQRTDNSRSWHNMWFNFAAARCSVWLFNCHKNISQLFASIPMHYVAVVVVSHLMQQVHLKIWEVKHIKWIFWKNFDVVFFFHTWNGSECKVVLLRFDSNASDLKRRLIGIHSETKSFEQLKLLIGSLLNLHKI